MGKILIIEKTQERSASEEIQIKNIDYLGVAEKYPDMLPILNGFSIMA
jgi:hypothetical protein